MVSAILFNIRYKYWLFFITWLNFTVLFTYIDVCFISTLYLNMLWFPKFYNKSQAFSEIHKIANPQNHKSTYALEVYFFN